MKVTIRNPICAALFVVSEILCFSSYSGADTTPTRRDPVTEFNGEHISQTEYYSSARDLTDAIVSGAEDSSKAHDLLIEMMTKHTEAATIGDMDLKIMEDLAGYLLARAQSGDLPALNVSMTVAQYLGQIRQEHDPLFADRIVFLNVPPPPSTRQFFHSGMTPDMIEDDVVRAEYMQAIEENARNARINARQRTLNKINVVLSPKFQEFLIGIRHEGGIADIQLEEIMSTAGFTEKEMTRIRSRIAYEQSLKPPQRTRDRSGTSKPVQTNE